MSTFVYDLPAGVDQSSPWPYNEMPKEAPSTGTWALFMDAGGTMVIWHTTKKRPSILDGSLVVCRGTKEELLHFLSTFGSRGRPPRPDNKKEQEVAKILVDQGGVFYKFNWVSQTVAQLRIASQVAEKLKADDWDGAWAIGRAFEDQIRAAQSTSV